VVRGKRDCLRIIAREPFNAEPPPDMLRSYFLTPNSLFFVRNHGAVPTVDPERYQLTVGGAVNRPLRLCLDELQDRFAKFAVVASLECAGNRRREFFDVASIRGELDWDAQAIGNAVWAGARLRDVLDAAEIGEGARHIAFEGLDVVGQNGTLFGGSIPIEKAQCADTLLAYEMNGDPLPPSHGFPLRVVVPGYIGARSVKWLTRINAQSEPSTSLFQSKAYKLFPPDVNEETADWSKGLTLTELPVNSAICCPQDHDVLPAGLNCVRGYAIAGGRRLVTRVEVSIDGGHRWTSANLEDGLAPGCWCFWNVVLDLDPGWHQVIARAWDSDGNTQPQNAKMIWNFKGYTNNAWHRISLLARGS
jgi:sulfite oxidase